MRSTTFTFLLLLLCLVFPLLAVPGASDSLPACGIASPIYFTLVGGLALFVLILFSLQFVNTQPDTPEGLLLILLLLFNPLIGFMGSGSAASLAGTALTVGILTLTIRDDDASEEQLLAGICFTGIVAGIFPSYLPLVLLPALIAFGRSRRKGTAIVIFIAAVAVWLVPSIIATGAEEWLGAAGSKVSTYITILNERAHGFHGLEAKRLAFLQNLFTEGLGGYRAGGGVEAIVVAIGLVLCVARGVWWMFHRETDGLIITIASLCAYIAFLLFYTNDVPEGGHILPILPIILFTVWAGAVQLMRGGWGGRLAMILFLSAYVAVGIGLRAS